MHRHLSAAITLAATLALTPFAQGDNNAPPPGFAALFNGKDLSGWHGMGHFNPNKLAAMSPADRAAKREKDMKNLRQHWGVEGGEIINDGKGVYLTTDKEYRDFELLLDWKMMKAGGDSGIYLRATPQVQIWDPANPKEKKNGADKGSGGMWNNAGDGKFPIVKADNPIGEWNTFRIIMIGERVTIYFNGQLVVAEAKLDNFWDRGKPLHESGPIQLQTHGSEMRFRNVFIREITPQSTRVDPKDDGPGFATLFNGKDLDGWIGATANYTAENGAIKCKPGKGGNLFTKDEYGDFVFRCEFKLPPGGNNGLGIRAPLKGDVAYSSMELQVLDNTSKKYAKLKTYQYHGSIYGVVPAKRGYLMPLGQWNYQEVTAKGSQITIKLNGATIVDADLSKIDKTIDGRNHPGLHRPSGHIGFAGHSSPVEFRHVRVKRLD